MFTLLVANWVRVVVNHHQASSSTTLVLVALTLVLSHLNSLLIED